MAVRYKYQLVQALDDKIGPDLRRVVEGYLGLDREHFRSQYDLVCRFIEFTLAATPFSVSWLHRQDEFTAYQFSSDHWRDSLPSPDSVRTSRNARALYRYITRASAWLEIGRHKERAAPATAPEQRA